MSESYTNYTVDGVAVRHFSGGSASGTHPIILIHGGNHGSWQWERYAPYLAQHHHDVHVIDWFDHGDSQRLERDVAITRSIGDVVAEIKAVATALDKVPTLIGHSMGGLAAIRYATLHDAHRLVAIAPTPPKQAQQAVNLISVSNDDMFPVPPFDVAQAMFFTSMSEDEARACYERLVPASPQMVWEASRGTLWVDLAKFTTPTLCVAAELDALFPVSVQQQVASLVHAEFVVVPGVGHSDIVLRSDKWMAGAEKIVRWLDQPR